MLKFGWNKNIKTYGLKCMFKETSTEERTFKKTNLTHVSASKNTIIYHFYSNMIFIELYTKQEFDKWMFTLMIIGKYKRSTLRNDQMETVSAYH